jgi:hypothetical protein
MENKKSALIKGRKIQKIIHKKNNKAVCRHDYKNSIQVGNVDYMCPLCRKLLNPLEWFLMNSFEFIDVDVVKKNKNFNVTKFSNIKKSK